MEAGQRGSCRTIWPCPRRASSTRWEAETSLGPCLGAPAPALHTASVSLRGTRAFLLYRHPAPTDRHPSPARNFPPLRDKGECQGVFGVLLESAAAGTHVKEHDSALYRLTLTLNMESPSEEEVFSVCTT
ncbi:unnamed protein product [Boreogadus saida]